MALEFPQDNWQTPNNPDDGFAAAGEFSILMSLALDDMLDNEETSRFHRYMEQDPALANEWQVWRDLNTQLDDEPSMMPPVDFVAKVASGLVLQQRRSKLKLGIMVGAITTVAWFLLVFAVVGAGAYLATYQGAWITEQIASLTNLTTAVMDWTSIAARDLTRMFNVTAGSYQMWGILLAYVAAAGAVLLMWTRMLRRSVNIGQIAAS